MVHDLSPLRGEIVAFRPIRGEAGACHPNPPLSPVDHVVSFHMSQKSGSNDKGLSVTAAWATGSAKSFLKEVA